MDAQWRLRRIDRWEYKWFYQPGNLLEGPEKGWRSPPIFYAQAMSLPGARETLEMMLGHLGLIFEIEEREQAGRNVLNIRTREPARILGRDGDNLEDLQYLLNRILNRHEEGTLGVIVDVENYRQKEKQDFLSWVREMAERVRETGEPYTLSAMNSFDRRLVHQAFADDPEILTRSQEGTSRLKEITLVRKGDASTDEKSNS